MINCELVVASVLTDFTVAIIRDTVVWVADAAEAIPVVIATGVVFGKLECVVGAFGLIAKMAVVAPFVVVITIGSGLGLVTVLTRAWGGAVVIHIDVETVLAPCEIVSVVDTAGESLAMDVVASEFGFVIVILFNMVESALPVVTAGAMEEGVPIVNVASFVTLVKVVSIVVVDNVVVGGKCRLVVTAAVGGDISVVTNVCFAALVKAVSVVVFDTVVPVGDCESVLAASEVTPIILVVIFVASAILVSVVAVMNEVLGPFVVDAEVSKPGCVSCCYLRVG